MNSSKLLESVLRELDVLGIELPRGRVNLTTYGDSPELERELVELIKSGSKTASASLVWAYEAEGLPAPEPGDIEIVVGAQGQPEVVTQIQSVEILPYSDVSFEHAALEGEGDKSLQHWRKGHWRFFSRECGRLGLLPSEQMLVVCTRFKVLNVVA